MSEEKKKLGIEETKDVFDFLTDSLLGLAAAKADDGKIDMVEYAKVAMREAPEAFKAMKGADEIMAELGDLDDLEKEELLDKGLELAQAAMKLFGLIK